MRGNTIATAPPDTGAGPQRSANRLTYFGCAVLAVVVLAGASFAILALIRSQGIRPTGDEPHYLVAALAIERYHTLAVGDAYNYAVAHNTFITWGKPPVEQVVPSHGRLFAYHEPGLAIVLALPLAIGGLSGVYAGLVLMASILTVWLCHLTGRLSSSSSPWRICIAGLFLVPANLLATTQIYPDLISGLLMAIVLMLIGIMERTRRSSWPGLICCGLLLGCLPWLHIQNIIFGAVLVVALVAVTWWRRLALKPLMVGLAIVVVLWLLMAVYNDYVFGRPEGPAGNMLTWGALSWTRILALLVDRQQGLFIQFPMIVLALAAFWMLRRKLPVTVLATILVSASVILVSGASSNSFGGTSFVGRFNWAVFPALLAFSGLYLIEMWRKRPAIAATLIAIIGVLCVVQLVPIAKGTHEYYSTAWTTPPPPAGPAWWSHLDRLIPSFNQLLAAWKSTRVVWGVLLIVALVALVSYVCILFIPGRHRFGLVVAPALVAAALVTLVGTVGSAAQTMAPMTATAASMPSGVGHVNGSARTVTAGPPGYLVYGPYWTLPSGDYQATVYFSLRDPQQHVALADVDIIRLPLSPHTTNAKTLAEAFLPASGNGKEQLRFSVGYNGLLEVRVFWTGTGTMTVRSIEIGQGSNANA
jgi:hypothetical protein